MALDVTDSAETTKSTWKKRSERQLLRVNGMQESHTT